MVYVLVFWSWGMWDLSSLKGSNAQLLHWKVKSTIGPLGKSAWNTFNCQSVWILSFARAGAMLFPAFSISKLSCWYIWSIFLQFSPICAQGFCSVTSDSPFHISLLPKLLLEFLCASPKELTQCDGRVLQDATCCKYIIDTAGSEKQCITRFLWASEISS